MQARTYIDYIESDMSLHTLVGQTYQFRGEASGIFPLRIAYKKRGNKKGGGGV